MGNLIQFVQSKLNVAFGLLERPCDHVDLNKERISPYPGPVQRPRNVQVAQSEPTLFPNYSGYSTLFKHYRSIQFGGADCFYKIGWHSGLVKCVLL